jgi:hypothetical protein
MLQNIAIGSALVALTVLIHTVGLILIAAITPPAAKWFGFHSHIIGRTLVMTGTVLGLLGIMTVEVWVWGLSFSLLGVTKKFADGLFLSTAMYSTIGYGELRINPAWKLLTAFEGINGFLMIGWTTAYRVGAATRHGPFRQGVQFCF